MSLHNIPFASKSPHRSVQSLHVIYDADGTITGELVYLAKKILGLAHCAACDITHGARSEKPEFQELKQEWPVPVMNIHRDEMDDAMTAAVEGILPCVVARTKKCAGDGKRDVLVMGPRDLETCAGDVWEFGKRVRECVSGLGLEMGDFAAGRPVCAIRRRRGVPEVLPVEKEKTDWHDLGHRDAVVPMGNFYRE